MIALTTTPTDPRWWLIFYVIAGAFIVAVFMLAASNGLIALLSWIDERDQKRAAIDAETFDDIYGPLALYGPSGEAYDYDTNLPRRGWTA